VQVFKISVTFDRRTVILGYLSDPHLIFGKNRHLPEKLTLLSCNSNPTLSDDDNRQINLSEDEGGFDFNKDPSTISPPESCVRQNNLSIIAEESHVQVSLTFSIPN
jgi:hypothetical protein